MLKEPKLLQPQRKLKPRQMNEKQSKRLGVWPINQGSVIARALDIDPLVGLLV
jgi:hypothetical protein